jgi:hypothetical protein
VAAARDEPVVLYDERDLLRDPEYRSAEFAQVRSSMPLDYPGLIEELGLSAEQAGRLFDLLAEIQLQKRAANAPIVLGQAPDVAALQQMAEARQAIQRQRDASIAAGFGGGVLEKFQRYETERGARNRVDSLGRNLAAAGFPLEEAQRRPLIEAYAAEEQRERDYQAERNRQRGPESLDLQRMLAEESRLEAQDISRREERNRRLLEAARPHLDTAQLDAFTRQLDQELARDRAAFRLQREQDATQGR